VPTFWVGGLNLPNATESEKAEITSVLKEMNCFPIFIPALTHQNHYIGMCKQVLWPAFHNIDLLDLSTSGYGNVAHNSGDPHSSSSSSSSSSSGNSHSAWDQVRIQKDWWDAYEEVNQLFLSEVSKHLLPNDTAWIHDYHLALLPKLLEDSELQKFGKRQTHSVFFLHIPFPTSQIFRELECGDKILEGILSADVVGFHTFDYARHFLNACKRIMGLSYESKFGGLIGLQYHSRTVMVTTSHVSIEPSRLTASLRNPGVHETTSKILKKHDGKMIIGGIDLAQRLSGVILKFLAYENLLDDYPVYQKKVVLLQRCFTSNTRAGDEDSTLKSIRKIVARIKRKFGDDCIDYEEAPSFPMDARVAIWQSSDVYLGSAIREGLNLMPLEYVFCKQEDPGAVVMSEFSAACNILNGALRVNPFDVEETANVIDVALKMEASEKQKRMRRDIDFVSSRSSSSWSKHILKDLKDAVKATAGNSDDVGSQESWVSEGEISTITHINIANVVSAYKGTGRRVIICDYGGTILSKESASKYLKKDISATSGRVPRKQIMTALRNLCSDPNTTVFVVSGVNRRELENALGDVDGLGLAASNGACFAMPKEQGQEREWQAFQFGVDWEKVKAVALPIMSKYAARTNGSSLKMLDLSISWSFFSCDPEWGKIQAEYIVPELTEKLKDLGVQVVTLKGQVEIVPIALNKGMVTKRLLKEVAAKDGQYPQFLLAVGDDKSDEPMFESVFSFLAEQASENTGDGQLSVAPLGSRQNSVGSADGSKQVSIASPSVRRLSKAEMALTMPPFTPGTDQYAYTVTVGKKGSTAASEYLHNSREVETLLTLLGQADSVDENTLMNTRTGSGSWDSSHQVDSSFYDL
jgi:trehalose 6-phosphate synthase/phosphatase